MARLAWWAVKQMNDTPAVCFPVEKYVSRLADIQDLLAWGAVSRVVGLTIESAGPPAKLGDLCCVFPQEKAVPLFAEVVGFKGRQILLMPLGEVSGVGPGSRVQNLSRRLCVEVGPGLLGRVLDGLGRPMDEGGLPEYEEQRPLDSAAPHPLSRRRIEEPLSVGVRAIDSLITLGKGQRVGIFAGSGVGKSTLLGMVARNTEADVNVIALVGERGREVREFLERDLGEEGRRRSVVVVATSDQPPLVRLKGALTATAIAEYFRDQGHDVLFMMDSVTRVANAQREVGLAAGEPPTTKGYTPSVFALLPKLLERTGTGSRGTITGLYTVLVDGDDLFEPIADAVRSILDGHIVLSRALAEEGHYPAIDVGASVSRVMNDITDEAHQAAARRLRQLLAAYKEMQDLINVGAYEAGSNELVDEAIGKQPEIRSFLRQAVDERSDFRKARQMLLRLVGMDEDDGFAQV